MLGVFLSTPKVSIVIAKFKNKFQLSAPFKAQGRGGDLYLEARQHTHKFPLKHRSTEQPPPRRKCFSFWLVQRAWQTVKRTEMGKYQKAAWSIHLCVSRRNREVWVALDGGVLRWLYSHIKWKGLTVFISLAIIFLPPPELLFPTPDLQINNRERKTVLIRVVPNFQVAWRGKYLWKTHYLGLVHRLAGQRWENIGQSSSGFFSTFPTSSDHLNHF